MKYFVYFLLAVSAIAETNYVYFRTDLGQPLQVSKSWSLDNGVLRLGDVAMSGIDWTKVQLAVTTDPIPDPFTSVSQVTLTRVLPRTPEEEQAAKPTDVKKAENAYLLMCEQLTGSKDKLGFDELNTRIEALMATDPNAAMLLSLKLLSLNSKLVKLAGVQWWDTCSWHPEVVE